MSTRYQCEFRQGLSSQNCFLHMIEKWRACVDDGQITGTILTDLSKAFGCINHDLLIAKLAAYSFSYESLIFFEFV